MANGHRSQIKRERNAVKDTRPSAKLSYARVSVQKACFVLDAIRGKDVQTALGILYVFASEGLFRIRCHQRQRRTEYQVQSVRLCL